MAGKRKRRHSAKQATHADSKKPRINDFGLKKSCIIADRLLSYYYPNVQTLGGFLIDRLGQKSSFARRVHALAEGSDVLELLKDTVVGSFKLRKSLDDDNVRARDFQDFTQCCTAVAASTRRTSGGTAGISSSLGDGSALLSELVDFAIWRTFHRTFPQLPRPPHILCIGFQRGDIPSAAKCQIAGLSLKSENAQMERLKRDDWALLLQMMGKGGDYVVLDLLLDCGIFVPTKAGRDNYLQLSGLSVAEMPTLDRVSKEQQAIQANIGPRPTSAKPAAPRLPSAISFVRSRMFYTRGALNAKGAVHVGLRHIHVLNRYPDASDETHTKHIMKYIFPRQFGLHNVFTSRVDRRETSQPFKDYTLREQEILGMTPRQRNASLPKRLRGECFKLVQKLQRLGSRCAYKELLKHYCPADMIDQTSRRRRKRKSHPSTFPGSAAFNTHSQLTVRDSQKSANLVPNNSASEKAQLQRRRDIVELATPVSHVSAFVRAVIGNILPRGFLGEGEDGLSNWRQLHMSIDEFLKCKRFENMTLEAACHGVKISAISWLRPPRFDAHAKLSQSDFSKRQELLHELMYYVFDSLVIPLVRANFHVTESNDHKYRLFFFRHDVWRLAMEPALISLKTNLYQEIPSARAQYILAENTLGHSHIRMLPKRAGARPITNLRRRPMIKQGGKQFLGLSINSQLKHVFTMLTYEKEKQAHLLGSAIHSTNELYRQLKRFKQDLSTKGLSERRLFMVKVDVQSCFDTIPQEAVFDLVESFCQREVLTVKNHVQIKAVPAAMDGTFEKTSNIKPSRKFLAAAHATASSQGARFPELVESKYASERGGVLFVENSFQHRVDCEALLDLLSEHITRNIVKIGKKYYRQKNGIPQGSVLSTLLCNLFYGDFERNRLGFLRGSSGSSHCILLRLVDDFLLITTDQSQAEKFLEVMLDGDADYGIQVKPEKTVVNFEPSGSSQSTQSVLLVDRSAQFPWCGQFIDPRTLGMSRDRTRGIQAPNTRLTTEPTASSQSRPRTGRTSWMQNPDTADIVTTEAIKRPGASFYRKTLAAVRLNVQQMYTDTALASAEQVKRELQAGLDEVARKTARYMVRLTSLARGRRGVRITEKVLRKTIEDAATLTIALTRGRDRGLLSVKENDGKGVYECRVSRDEIRSITATAFLRVLEGRQPRHKDVVAWLKTWV